MSRRSFPLLSPRSHDGATQHARRLAALAPEHAPVDERTHADLLHFVQAFAERLRFFEADEATGEVRAAGTWSAFTRAPGVSPADLVAYLQDPTGFADERARWLGRPHLALVLAFLRLAGHGRDFLNGFTRRHLDHFYRDVLRMEPAPPVADRAAVLFRLAPGVAEARLRAGTELSAGRDASGRERVYVTERDLVINRAAVGALRSVFVDRRIVGIPDTRTDGQPTASQALDASLRLALGRPGPGGEVPKLDNQAVDAALLRSLRPTIDLATTHLHLAHHELRSLMRLVRRRSEGVEWPVINDLLGVVEPADPRDFEGNLRARVADPLDFTTVELAGVNSLEDLYAHRTDPVVRTWIGDHLRNLASPGHPADVFAASMALKLRVDAEWAEVNRLLQLMGRRHRPQDPLWSLPPGDPTQFTERLGQALGDAPIPWPAEIAGIDAYEDRLRSLEMHFGMRIERLDTLAAFAGAAAAGDQPLDWTEVDRILADAHREKLRAERIGKLETERKAHLDVQGFDATASFVLGEPLDWAAASERLSQLLGARDFTLLSRFRAALAGPAPALEAFGWADADRLFELAWRRRARLPEPVAERTEVRNVYAYEDATRVAAGTGDAGVWRTFGTRPTDAQKSEPLGAPVGWALRSPLLSLAEGRRALTLTIGLRSAGFDRTAFLAALGLAESEGGGLREKLAGALRIEATTADGWVPVQLESTRLASGVAGDDYWSLRELARPLAEDRPALQLELLVDTSGPPLAPLEGEDTAGLRLILRPQWHAEAKEWRTAFDAFAPLQIAAVHLEIRVGARPDEEAAPGLATLRFQAEDRLLDPKKPFEPFGSRPAVGARLYLDHPELVRARLDWLRFDVEWMGLPASLPDRYVNYPERESSGAFQVNIALVDGNAPRPLTKNGIALFEDTDGDAAPSDQPVKTKPTRTLAVPGIPAVFEETAPGWKYEPRTDGPASSDVRRSARYLSWELSPIDFGHLEYPALAGGKARQLAVRLSRPDDGPDQAELDSYRVDPPYTPTIRRLGVSYGTSIELEVGGQPSAHQWVHVHPFGEAAVPASDPTLFPRYDHAGELYVGLRDLDPPRHVTLLFQLAEGTSDPELGPASIQWSYLSNGAFVPLAGTAVVHDSTRGLASSGIVELALPAATPGGRLPPDLYWIRVAIPRSTRAACDALVVRAQAVSARFDDRGNAPAHYEQPLPEASIDRLRRRDALVAVVEQPFTSAGGRPPERPEVFDARVSERLRHKARALTPWDYERLVLDGFPQIYTARCFARDGAVEVIVIPDVRALRPSDTFAPRAPAELLARVQGHLAARAPPCAQIRVRNARYVPVLVRLAVRFRAGEDEGFAQRRLNEEIVRFLSPWAFDDGAEVAIGGRIYANSILEFVDRRDYVDWVAHLELVRLEEGKRPEVAPSSVNAWVDAAGPDEVLVSARQHFFDSIPESGYQQSSFTGIGYARIGLDFIVA